MGRPVLANRKIESSFTILVWSGRWEDRQLFNVPGPYYATTDNLNSWGEWSAPGDQFLLFGPTGPFLWRQPQTLQEVQFLFASLEMDESMSYANDGDAHWSRNRIDDWQHQWYPKLLRWIDSDEAASMQPEQHEDPQQVAPKISKVRNYLRTRLPADLAAYRALGPVRL